MEDKAELTIMGLTETTYWYERIVAIMAVLSIFLLLTFILAKISSRSKRSIYGRKLTGNRFFLIVGQIMFCLSMISSIVALYAGYQRFNNSLSNETHLNISDPVICRGIFNDGFKLGCSSVLSMSSSGLLLLLSSLSYLKKEQKDPESNSG